jgi:hypothetical protein
VLGPVEVPLVAGTAAVLEQLQQVPFHVVVFLVSS